MTVMFCTPVDVVIPTKSNICGVRDLLSVLRETPAVRDIYVVADGSFAFSELQNEHGIILSCVEEASGIHVMWNIALNRTDGLAHMFFLNDDVQIDNDTVEQLSKTIDSNPTLGLACPRYAPEVIDLDYRPVTDICGGRYDGTGGLAGFAMMLRNSLVPEWRFDERMKWWFGDNDILLWVTITKGLHAGIARDSSCSDNESWTITNDPPADFNAAVKMDEQIFKKKWTSNAG